MAVNDCAERSFGILTSQLQFYSRVGLANAGAVSQARVNSDLSRSHERGGPRCRKAESSREESGKKGLKKGLFHLLPEEMKALLLTVAMQDGPSARRAHQANLPCQRRAKHF